MQRHQSRGFMGNLETQSATHTAGMKRATNLMCLWKFHQGITVNWKMIYYHLKMLHAALLRRGCVQYCEQPWPHLRWGMNHSSSSTNASLYTLHGKFTFGISSQDRVAWLQAWRVAASCGFLLFSAHITDLQTCEKFTRAVNVTYCKRWK